MDRWLTFALFVVTGTSVGIAFGKPWYGVAATVAMSAAANFLVTNLQTALSMHLKNQRVFAERLEKRLEAIAAAIEKEKS